MESWRRSTRRAVELVFSTEKCKQSNPEFLFQFLLFFFYCRMKFSTWSCLRSYQIEFSLRLLAHSELDPFGDMRNVYVRHPSVELRFVWSGFTDKVNCLVFRRQNPTLLIANRDRVEAIEKSGEQLSQLRKYVFLRVLSTTKKTKLPHEKLNMDIMLHSDSFCAILCHKFFLVDSLLFCWVTLITL